MKGRNLERKQSCDTCGGGVSGSVRVLYERCTVVPGGDVQVVDAQLFGSGARNVLRPGPENRDLLCDAAIAAIVEGAG